MALVNFPRKEEHCLSHHIPVDVVKLSDDCMSSTEEREDALKYLQEIKADLVKGDLILFDGSIGYRNDGVAIFDGENIVDLASDVDDYGALPSIFHVIENNVPINYWNDIDESSQGRGIRHNTIVWFDHNTVRDQCIGNIKYDKIEDEKWSIFTTFTVNDQQYRIIYDYVDSFYDKSMDHDTYCFNVPDTHDKVIIDFKDILMSDDPVAFNTYSEYYEESMDDKTLVIVARGW